MIATIVIEIVGAVVMLFTFREVFHDIFHPTRSGSLSDLIGHLCSKAFRHTRLRPAIGPLALVLVIFSWVVLLTVGFALLYFPLIPAQIATGASHQGIGGRVIRSLAWSLGSLDTFKTFDMDLKRGPLELLVAFEGLVGISLITASISWLVLIYPALERTRFLAKRTFVLIRAQNAIGLGKIESDSLLTDMADRVIQLRIDLILFPILLNFYPRDPNQALAKALPHMQRIAKECSDPACRQQVRFAAAQLHEALIDFSILLSERVLHSGHTTMEAAFNAFIERAS